jgi:hypothetical protein
VWLILGGADGGNVQVLALPEWKVVFAVENMDLTPPLLRDHPHTAHAAASETAATADPDLLGAHPDPASSADAPDAPDAVQGAVLADAPDAADGTDSGATSTIPAAAAAAVAAEAPVTAPTPAPGLPKEESVRGVTFVEINLRWIGRNPLLPPYLLVRHPHILRVCICVCPCVCVRMAACGSCARAHVIAVAPSTVHPCLCFVPACRSAYLCVSLRLNVCNGVRWAGLCAGAHRTRGNDVVPVLPVCWPARGGRRWPAACNCSGGAGPAGGALCACRGGPLGARGGARVNCRPPAAQLLPAVHQH